MTNADKFKGIFGIYATELWSKPYSEFSEWLNEDVPDTNAGDTISRRAAIDALYKMLHDCFWADDEELDAVITTLNELSSAQPEPLTDKEQRIFLAGMGREEKVCKQVDDECRDCREPYEDSLVRVCREIERKVKGALWTN